MSHPHLLPSPSLLRRLAAMFYDVWLILAIWFVAIALLMLIKFIVFGAPEGNERMLGGTWRLPTFLLMLLTTLYFFAYFWIKNQQTLAMQTWRIQIVDETTGKAISWKQAYIRFFAACLSFALLGMGYWWVILDKEGKSWHDYLSGTRLILLPKRQ